MTLRENGSWRGAACVKKRPHSKLLDKDLDHAFTFSAKKNNNNNNNFLYANAFAHFCMFIIEKITCYVLLILFKICSKGLLPCAVNRIKRKRKFRYITDQICLTAANTTRVEHRKTKRFVICILPLSAEKKCSPLTANLSAPQTTL